ncbi:copper resistance protein NlpE N-terminal domain-containing protein [Sphingomonas flavalba]|uniref:copper resistance protein NlpE N-terminal domain-containing protein n=1 Tax=Sphingomonas flavalba TaxID=2559804 RepID=UPI00109DF3FD|nr:copper resistance protein NlpE N-terminal domain-containing protein [Sphingomonas flavalba]
MSANRLAALATLPLALLAGCDREPQATPEARAGAVKTIGGNAVVEIDYGNAAEPAPAPMAWTTRVDGTAAAALYGASDKDVALAVRCDARGAALIVLRQGPGNAVRIDSGGAGQTYAGRNAGGRAEARIPLADPLLDRIAAPGARVTVSAGGDAVEAPGGHAIRRVLDACRGPQAPIPAGATFAGSTPCPDCEAIDVTLTFAAEPGPGRYRLIQAFRGRGSSTTDGLATVTDATGRVLRLQPDAADAPVLYIEQAGADEWAFRTSDNKPSDTLRAYPLSRQP